jgi:hypothetical protein
LPCHRNPLRPRTPSLPPSELSSRAKRGICSCFVLFLTCKIFQSPKIAVSHFGNDPSNHHSPKALQIAHTNLNLHRVLA